VSEAPARPEPELPIVAADERHTALAFLGYLRAAVDHRLEGLDEADARRRLVPSDTTLLGVVKHLTVVEVYWSERRLAGADVGGDGDGFDLDDADTVASVRHAYDVAGRRTDELVRACPDLDQPLARGRHGLTVRWMLTHLIEETARHAGHVDILRELIDSSGGR